MKVGNHEHLRWGGAHGSGQYEENSLAMELNGLIPPDYKGRSKRVEGGSLALGALRCTVVEV